MKVFIAGATGVLGRRVVRRLAAAGHFVVGLSRSAANAEWLGANGAEARAADLFDAESVTAAAAGCEAVLHLATAIPTHNRPARTDWDTNDRIRREGTRALLAAARQNGCRLYVQQSITYFYGDHGDEWVDETTPVTVMPGGVLESAMDMERMVLKAAHDDGLPAVILRLGMFYSHDSASTRQIVGATRRGIMPIIGKGDAYWSYIHAEDAAGAVAAVVAEPDSAIGGLFNVVDDEPARYREVVGHLARALGARRPMHMPPWLAKVLLGKGTAGLLTTSNRVRNDLFKRTLGWKPEYPTFREGYSEVVRQG
jgi:nucleoside-diphosphate-sugar epimerase